MKGLESFEFAIHWLRSRKIDSLLYLSTGADQHETQLFYDEVWRKQRSELGIVLQSLLEHDTQVIVFKGAEFLETFYEPHSINLMIDVDLLVRQTQIAGVKPILHSLGYRQGFFSPDEMRVVDRDIAEIATIESTHYELAPFVKLVELPSSFSATEALHGPPVWTIGDKSFLTIEFDVHHRVATDLDSEQFFERAVSSRFDGAMTMSPEDHLWFTATRLYNEVALHGKTSLRDFAYLTPHIASTAMDWDVVIRSAADFELHASLFYYLGFLNWLVPDVVPTDVLTELDPRQSRRLRDWGWQLEKLLDITSPAPFVC